MLGKNRIILFIGTSLFMGCGWATGPLLVAGIEQANNDEKIEKEIEDGNQALEVHNKLEIEISGAILAQNSNITSGDQKWARYVLSHRSTSEIRSQLNTLKRFMVTGERFLKAANTRGVRSDSATVARINQNVREVRILITEYELTLFHKDNLKMTDDERTAFKKELQEHQLNPSTSWVHWHAANQVIADIEGEISNRYQYDLFGKDKKSTARFVTNLSQVEKEIVSKMVDDLFLAFDVHLIAALNKDAIERANSKVKRLKELAVALQKS